MIVLTENNQVHWILCNVEIHKRITILICCVKKILVGWKINILQKQGVSKKLSQEYAPLPCAKLSRNIILSIHYLYSSRTIRTTICEIQRHTRKKKNIISRCPLRIQFSYFNSHFLCVYIEYQKIPICLNTYLFFLEKFLNSCANLHIDTSLQFYITFFLSLSLYIYILYMHIYDCCIYIINNIKL